MSPAKRPLALLFTVLLPLTSQAMSLEEWLQKVRDNNPVLQAINNQKKAAALKQREGDLQELSPVLTANAQGLDDRKPQLVPAFSGDRTRNETYSLGVSKKFDTGTTANLTYSQQHTQITGSSFGDVNNWTGSLGLGLSQALWQNAFGRATDLRQAREDLTTRASRLNLSLEEKQTLIRAEQAYWQWVRASNEKAVRQEELSSAQRLIKWAQDRVSKQLSDRSDLLQAQALLQSTELLVIGNDDEYLAAVQQLEQFVPGVGGQLKLENAPKILQNPAPSKPFAFPTADDLVRLDALLLETQSQVAGKAAEEVSERLKPDLSLYANYNTNSLEQNFSDSAANSFETGKPTTVVGVRLTVLLDQAGKEDVRSGYRADAQALSQRAQNARREGSISYGELVRRYGELLKRIEVAKKLVEIQEAKLKREVNLLQLGRSSTFQAITFERETTASRLALLQLLVEQRNLEAQTRLFVNKNSPEAL